MNAEQTRVHYQSLLTSAVAWFNINPFQGTALNDSFRQFTQQYIQALTAYIRSLPE